MERSGPSQNGVAPLQAERQREALPAACSVAPGSRFGVTHSAVQFTDGGRSRLNPQAPIWDRASTCR